MQCGAKMNMVTFSAFEKQICNILYLLHKFRTHAGSSSHAGSGKILPTPLENPARTPCKKAERTPREPPSSPRVNRRNTLNFVLKTLWSLPPESSTGTTYSFSVQAAHSPEARSLAPQIPGQRDVHRQSAR